MWPLYKIQKAREFLWHRDNHYHSSRTSSLLFTIIKTFNMYEQWIPKKNKEALKKEILQRRQRQTVAE